MTSHSPTAEVQCKTEQQSDEFPTCSTCGERNVEDAGDHADQTGHWPTSDQQSGSGPVMRVYLPDTFINDAKECNPDIWELWERIEALPRVRRGGGHGRWADLTQHEARSIQKEAEYRAEYWLTDSYGVEGVTSSERTAGHAARRVAQAINKEIGGA